MAEVGRRCALVTGGTAGIGAAFARRLAGTGHDLILVARDEARLSSVAADLGGAYGVRVSVIPADLATDEGCERVEARLRDAGTPVDLLVNNAGISLNRSFVRSSIADEQRLLLLNVHAVMRLTHAALGPMTERGSGAIVNVSSASGFAPVMPGSTYPATKAWVTNFTQSVAMSVAGRGVRVMALCPGYTRTEFHDRASIAMASIPKFLWLDAEAVVTAALADLDRGKLVSIPDWRYKLAVLGMRNVPAGLIRRIAPDRRGRTD